MQAKSGTGKTLVFALLCVEKVMHGNASPQVLLLHTAVSGLTWILPCILCRLQGT